MKRQELVNQLHTLALCIGLRPAARKLGVNEDTAASWSRRGKWQLADVFKITDAPMRPLPQNREKAAASNAHEAIEQSFREQSEDTRLFLSASALKAAYDASTATGNELRGKFASTGLLNVARTADVVHGWTAARQTPLVQIAHVTLPTPVEDAERKAVDRKLDAITKLLNE